MEILNTINNLEVRAKVAEAVNVAVQIRWSMEQSKSDIKEIADDLKEEHGVKPAEFKKIVETVFKNDLREKGRKLNDLSNVLKVLTATSDDPEDNLSEDD